ncbi:MAG: hypothetical protein ACKOSR_01465 [Flavobacteriales bacterium]
MAYSHIPASTPIIILASCINILFYLISGIGLTRNTFLPSAWKFTTPEMRPALIMKTASGLGFSYCYFAIATNELFFHHLHAYSMAGVIILTVVMFFSMRLLEDDQPVLNRGILFRAAILSAALTFYFVTPLSNRLEWRFDDVYYREVLQLALENPQDEDAQRDLLDYERRMQGVIPFEPMEQ